VAVDGDSRDPAGTDAAAEEAGIALKDAEWAEQAGLPERAVTAYRKVISLFPGSHQVHNNLANLLLELGQPAEALESAQSARALKPEDPLINANVGRAWLGLDKPDQAVPFLRLALQKQPDMHSLRDMLARALLEAGRPDEAAATFREIEGRYPDNFQLLEMMARFYQRARLESDAERCFLRMLQIAPGHAPTYGHLAELYMDFTRFSKANQVIRDGLQLEPDSAVFWNMFGNSQLTIGLVDEAIAAYRKVLELSPWMAPAHSNLLLTMHYVSGLDPARIFEEHQRFGRMHAPPTLATKAFSNTPEPERRLKIGYLSPDIRRHSVAFFLESLLDHRNRDRFEVYAYATVKAPDDVTQRLRGKFDEYRSLLGMPYPQVAGLIRSDQIDILIDLAGHAGSLHAAVLGYKAAPVQVTYLGYPDTTGIAAVDYRITDWIADPSGAEATHTEQLVRLPDGFLCFRPPENLPAIGDPPAVANGFVTFGSFNREFKVSQKTLDLWCRILQSVPGSRMLVKSIAGADAATREHLLGQFESRGVDPSRVQLFGFVPDQSQHLAMYRDVDIALDTFPYNGTTTTLDSLLMGVPVVTLSGYNHAGRVGASLLTQIGIPEFIARTDDEYVAMAVDLAGNPGRVAALHGSLRQRLLTSTLCDGPGFSRKFEYALRGMWLAWCRTQGAQLSPAQAAMAEFDFGPLGQAPV
jgi:predicted O-linked N-acetylglucosamine transferase (SPINDLY family)